MLCTPILLVLILSCGLMLVNIEGKSAMDSEEEDWGGKLGFGFSEKSFPKEILNITKYYVLQSTLYINIKKYNNE